MTERSTRTSVAFAHAFTLAGVDGLQPPGVYDVETVEATLDGVSFLAYRRISTTIELPARSVAARSRQLEAIDPDDLAAALARDAEASNGNSQI